MLILYILYNKQKPLCNINKPLCNINEPLYNINEHFGYEDYPTKIVVNLRPNIVSITNARNEMPKLVDIGGYALTKNGTYSYPNNCKFLKTGWYKVKYTFDFENMNWYDTTNDTISTPNKILNLNIKNNSIKNIIYDKSTFINLNRTSKIYINDNGEDVSISLEILNSIYDNRKYIGPSKFSFTCFINVDTALFGGNWICFNATPLNIYLNNKFDKIIINIKYADLREVDKNRG